jgi:hypothetical protein
VDDLLEDEALDELVGVCVLVLLRGTVRKDGRRGFSIFILMVLLLLLSVLMMLLLLLLLLPLEVGLVLLVGELLMLDKRAGTGILLLLPEPPGLDLEAS